MSAPRRRVKTTKNKATNVVKVKRRRKGFLEYFRCMTCQCRKEEDSENNNVLLRKNHNTTRPLSFVEDEEDSVRKLVEEVKKVRKFSTDSCHVSSIVKPPGLLGRLFLSLPDLRAQTYAVRARPILKKEINGFKLNGVKKKAHFSEEVDVYLCEFDAVVKSHLKTEPQESTAKSNGGRSRDLASRDIINSTRADRIFKLTSMDIERKTSGRRYLKIVIRVDEMSVRDRVTVCSARGGTRLVLTASTSEPLGDGTHYTRQLADKFRLPHPIDPCAIRAKVSSSGDLVIKADMFDFDEERSG